MMKQNEIEKIIQENDAQTAALNKGAVIRCLSFSKYQNNENRNERSLQMRPL